MKQNTMHGVIAEASKLTTFLFEKQPGTKMLGFKGPLGSQHSTNHTKKHKTVSASTKYLLKMHLDSVK